MHEAVADHPDAWPFVAAVDGREVPDYYDIIKDPVDLALIRRRLATTDYYASLEMFAAHFRRMVENCRIYNAPDTVYYKCATKCAPLRPPSPFEEFDKAHNEPLCAQGCPTSCIAVDDSSPVLAKERTVHLPRMVCE